MALQIAPLIVLERRILILLYLFMAGIILLPAGGIVLRAKGLTAACKDLETAFVLTSVTSRYPSYSGKLIYDISQKQDIVS